MLHSTFFKLLSTLSNNEILSFQEFVLAVHAKKKIPNRLLSYILSHGTNVAAWEKISIEKAYFNTFDQEFATEKHRKKIFNTLSELNAWLTNYLVWKEVEHSSMWRPYILAKVYFERGLFDSFEKLIRQSIKLIESIPNGFLRPLFLMMFYHVSYFNSTIIDLHKSSKLKLSLKYLEQFYLQTKLRYVGELVNRNNLREDNQAFLIPTDLLSKARQLEHQENNYMQLYYWTVQLSKNRKHIAYEKVKYYFNLLTFTDKEEEQEIMTYLLNFCAYNIRKGDFSYVEESLNLYKEALLANRLDFHLTENRFFNIVTIACGVKDVDWADYFIDTYAHKMKTPEGKDMVLLSKVRVFIQRKKYEEALSNLVHIKSKLFHTEKKRRAFQLKCLVELKENSELILNYCSNFLLYLKRDKFSSQEDKLSLINFIKVVQKLQKKVPKQDIVDFVDNTSSIAFKNWITEWLDQL